ncbi:natural cytotoxicity triggering receptor 2-like isoform X3 [Mus pahari]|uniref:natural cytotoxicity triggering receptor 2-like isoform X3 n=1 Tax=Mus pahari TaxID=10093 RepID=UPI000A306D41|nr:natural cytotoxicity triggering receptor 2-like isoform X3 [Mus pahari]
MAWDPTSLLSPVLLLLLASGSWAEDLEFYPAQEGETVSVTCWYDPLYRYNEKIWCKQIESLCHPSVTSVSTGDKKLRFSIQQSSQFNSFTVTMTDLKIDDSGFYRCGIVANNTSVFLRTILLVVSKGALHPVLLFPWSVDSSARHWYSLSYSLSHRSHFDNRP